MSEAIDQLSREERRRRVLRLRDHRRETGETPRLAAIPRRSGTGPCPLSFAQQRLWFLDQLEPGLFAYNISQTLRLNGHLDVRALSRSLEEIVRRHGSLRTTFMVVDGSPAQVVGPPGPVDLPVVDFAGLPEEVRETAARRLATGQVRRPFDLARGPLLRTVLLRLAPDQWVACFAMHHIISDGWSIGLFVRELVQLYAGFASGGRPSLPELPIQYADFASWQRQWLDGRVLEEQLDYWRQRLRGPLPTLQLPADHPYPAVRTYRGAHRSLGFPAALAEGLRGLARAHGATLFMTLLAALATLLHRYAGDTDILIGSPLADRNRVETEGLIGFFVNTVVLRIDLSRDPTFLELLERVRETALGAYNHRDVPFERLVEELQPDRASSRPPLFQVLMALENAPTAASLALPGLSLAPVPVETGSARFDLGLELTDTPRGLAGGVEYSTALFEAPTIGRLLDHLRSLLEGAVAGPGRRLSALPLLGEAERHQALVEWNDTGAAGAVPESVVERFAAQAESTPGATALVWRPGDGTGASLTYRELDCAANGLAHRLIAAGVEAETRVALLAERSPDLVVGVLGILKAGGAYVPLDPSYPAERLRFLLEDSGASVLAAPPHLLDRLPASGLPVVLLGPQGGAASGQGPAHRPRPGDLAYMIYTSGTTGTPKAVMVEHGSLAQTLRAARDAFGFGPSDRMPCLAPFSFDIFLFELLGPLLSGGTSVLLDLRPAPDLDRLAEELEEATLVHAVPALMRQIVATVQRARGRGRHFPYLRGIFVGGDAVPPELLADLRRTFPQARTWVLYGPTESTIICTSRAAGEGDDRPWIGRPLAGAVLRLLDSHGSPVPIGVPGEIWVGGPGVARGYWNRADLTAERFVTLAGERFFRTGDLARFLPDGTLVFLGRADHQVKVRGFRVEPGEIEAALALHPEVAAAAVLAREDVTGDRRLVAYVVPRDGRNGRDGQEDAVEPLEARLRAALAERLPEWMVPTLFALVESLPLTTHGKVDRRALLALEVAPPKGAGTYIAPNGVIEEALAAIWADLLGLERVGARDNFFTLGGHSLLATQVISRVRTAFGVEAPLRALFEEPTVAGLAARVERMRQAELWSEVPPLVPLPRGSRDRGLPLSFAQQRLWFLHQMDPESAAYNLPFAFRLIGPLDVPALAASLTEVARRHETLRTTLVLAGDAPVQWIAPPAPQPLPVIDLSALAAEAREGLALRLAREEAARPFDLTRPPVARTVLVRLSERDHALLFTIHHVSGDGWSVNMLSREVVELYGAAVAGRPARLPDLPVQYADFAVWQRTWLQGELLEAHLAYWRERLADPPPLDLPADRPRPAFRSFHGASAQAWIPGGPAAALTALGRRRNATPYMAFLAVFKTLLYRYTGQTDLLVGTPIANRNRTEIEGLIGFFVNTLALRSDLSRSASFAELLDQIREATLGAYTHQDLPFEKLVEELHPQRDTSRNPLFQVLFALQNVPVPTAGLPGLAMVPFGAGAGNATAKFDLTLTLEESVQGVAAGVEYSTDLFDAPTLVRLLEHLRRLVEGAAADPDRPLSELPLLGAPERHQLLLEWNDRGTARPVPSLHGLFEAQAALRPDAVAVACGRESLTYGELDRRANRLAHRLLALGAGLEAPVALCMERSPEMVLAILAVLKAGAAYVPLDPDYPQERLAFQLADSRAPVLLTQASLPDGLAALAATAQTLVLDHLTERPAATSPEPPPEVTAPVEPDGLAYVIYTSGSTGRPKGVMVPHRAIVHRILWMQEAFPLTPADAVLQKTPFSFDASIWELFSPLAAGVRLVMAEPGAHREPAALAQAIAAEDVTVLQLVPSMLGPFLDEEETGNCRSLARVFCGGEVLPAALRDRLFARLGAALCNLYGPTECAIDATFHPCRRDDDLPVVPIGRPLSHVQVYLLDRSLQPTALGAAGELCVGGAGLARGYLGRPDLTAERFVPDPFSGEPGARLYRTGDLARHRSDGTLDFLGRNNDQVKIRGFRIELGEIEAVLSTHPRVLQAVVRVWEEREQRRLAAYVVPAGDAPSADELRSFLAERLPAFMLPAAFVTLESLPLLPNGKIDRGALPAPEPPRRAGHEDAPRTANERLLAAIWSQVLRLDQVGVHDNFFELGGDSILSIQVVTRAARAGLRITPRQMFRYQTIAELAATAEEVSGSTAEQGPVTGPVRLNPIQRWFFERLPADPHHMNQALLLAPREPLPPAVVERAFAALLSHHDALRLRFAADEGGWRAWNEAPGGEAPWLHLDLSALPDSQAALEHAAGEVQAGLDFTAGPLLCGVWIDLGGHQERLLLVIHHLAVDGVSWRILLEDLETACRRLRSGQAVDLPPKTTSFQEWAERLETYAQGPDVEPELPWWRREAEAPASDLPLDHPGGENTEASARHVFVSLSAEETRALLQDLPAAYRTRINDVLLTALARTLAGPEGAVRVELEGHGREDVFDDVDLSRTVGWLTSLFPVRLAAGPADDPVAALKAVKEHLRAIPGRGLGYGLLRWLREDPATEPLRSAPAPAVSFNYLGQLDQALPEPPLFSPAPEAGGAARSPRHRRSHALMIGGFVAGGRLQMDWEYSEALHERSRVEDWASCFLARLRELIGHGRDAAERRLAGYTPSDFPLAGLGQPELDRLLGTEWGIEDVYPLSPLQEGILFHSLLEPGSGVYVEQLLAPLLGELDTDALESTCRTLVARHPVLRTSFHGLDQERPLQVVHGAVEVALEREDWRDIAPEELEQRLDQLLQADRARGFDLTRAPLLRWKLLHLRAGEHRLLWSHHHLLLDGWSSAVLTGEFFDLYGTLRRKEEPRLPQRRPFRDYIAWLQSQDLGRAEEHWRRVLAGWSEPTPLPGRPEGGPGAHGTDARDAYLPATATERLQALARSCRVTLNTLAQAAWGLLLGRYGGRGEVVFGATVSGRPPELAGVESMIGLFINTLPVRLQVEEGRVGPWLERIQAEQAELRQFEHTPLVKVRDWSEVRRGVPLFESILVFESYPRETSVQAAGGPSPEVVEVRTAAQTNYPLTVIVVPGDELALRIAYDASRFDALTVDRMLLHLRTVLGHLADDPQQSLAHLSLLTAAERLQLLGEWNDTQRDWPRPCALHELVEQAAERQPRATALLFEGEAVTYGELEARANRLARLLLRLGVTPETRVGLGFERSPDAIVAMLGVLKAGGTYVPLDPESPHDRLATIAADAGLSVLLTQSRLAATLSGLAGQTIAIDDPATGLEAESPERPGLPVAGDAAAYVIYTSGSTGLPKGVVAPHCGVVSFVRGLAAALSLDPADRLFLFAPLFFDASVLQIFPTLASGASLAIHRNPRELTSADLVALCARQGVTVLDLPAALWRQWVEEVAAQRLELPEDLRAFLTGGEKVPADRLRTWAGLTTRPISFLSSYGPTEATVTATVFQARNDRLDADLADGAAVPIGRPLPNVRTFLLDAHMRPLPWGVPGELYLGGEGLARGYLGRPDLTAESFVPDPLSGDRGARLYRTGDLASHRPDGSLEFQGRTDQQVKLRGFRLEPGEIEAALRRHPAVREAVVVLREDRPGDPRLVAYVLPEEGERVDPGELRTLLSGLLPAPMVPSAFVSLAELPVLPSGKLDRAALPAPTLDELAGSFVAPRDPLEQLLAEIWAQVLKVERVGAFDDFFELGGHSLLATQALARIRQTFEIDLQLRSLFEEPTVAGLAAVLRSSPDADKVEKTAALRIALAGLSDDEVEALLLAEAAAEKGLQS